ncbi:hypothetical protein [Streptomyces sp. DSM 41634]|uniref:hypothetical protein n=1 Tax=Streptomyces sp. DSM 41634 TaxID=3448656 RepID=UPI0028878FB0|nr:hypothetical protein [Streptomyces sp. DSM 41633]
MSLVVIAALIVLGLLRTGYQRIMSGIAVMLFGFILAKYRSRPRYHRRRRLRHRMDRKLLTPAPPIRRTR